ncbi:MAG: PorV/PorQ family protein [Calditrichia bacterium]
MIAGTSSIYKWIACILLVFLIPAFGQNSSSIESVGTSTANFLKIGVGARAVAMGGAYVALSEDVSAIYWNPGALARLSKNEAIIQQSNWLVDSKIYFVGASYNFPLLGTLGLGFHYFTSGDIEETTLSAPDGTGRTFTANDFSLNLAYSRRITERFSAGVALKYIQETLDRESAGTIAVDIGSIFETNFFNGMRIGMSLSNLGGRMHFSGTDLSVQYTSNPQFPTKVIRANLKTDDWDIPLLFRFGLASDVMKNDKYRLTLSSDVMDSRDFIHRIMVGGEFAFLEKVFLRGGYKFNYDEEKFSLGAGVNLNVMGSEMRLDYAYQDFGPFSNTQFFSFIFAF